MADFPYVPETITVHLGRPDEPAPNVTVPFLEYIQNVASSELYPTWPEAALRANIFAQISFALNRIYTEWYRSRGYDFDITNSTAFDQSFVYGRDIFENVAEIAADQFNRYLARPGFVQPLFAAYCDGRRVQCEGLSQWGTVDLANQGFDPYQILTYYYGDNLDIRAAPIRPAAESYPGEALRFGDISDVVETLQRRLNRIGENYPAIPKIDPVNSVFDLNTQNAVTAFQRIFGLTPDGVVGPATWYEINQIYNGVRRLGELDAEGITLQDVTRQLPNVLSEGQTGDSIRFLQYLLAVVASFNTEIPLIEIDGIFGPNTRAAVTAFQQYADLTPDGIVGRNTWNALLNAYDQTVRSQAPQLLPAGNLVLGSRSDEVRRVQELLTQLSTQYPQIPAVPATGYYGEQTRDAIFAFQNLFGLTQTGVVGPLTFQRLLEETGNFPFPS